MTDISQIAEQMREAAEECLNEAAQSFAGTGGRVRAIPVQAANVLAVYSALKEAQERADCAEQSEAELVQAAKDLDLQIASLRAERDALAVERDEARELYRITDETNNSLLKAAAKSTNEAVELSARCDALTAALKAAGEALEAAKKLRTEAFTDQDDFEAAEFQATFLADAALAQIKAALEKASAS